MKKFLLFAIILVTGSRSFSQLLSWSPAFPVEATSSLTITLDQTKGNAGLNGYTPTNDVYVHIGVITNLSTSSSNWRYVKFNQNFNTPNAALQAVYNAGTGKWSFTISQNLRT